MYAVIIALENRGEFESFEEAFAVFYREAKGFAETCPTETVFYGACGIEHDGLFMTFERVTDFAHEVGLLNERGQLQKIPAPPDRALVYSAFRIAHQQAAMVDMANAYKIEQARIG